MVDSLMWLIKLIITTNKKGIGAEGSSVGGSTILYFSFLQQRSFDSISNVQLNLFINTHSPLLHTTPIWCHLMVVDDEFYLDFPTLFEVVWF